MNDKELQELAALATSKGFEYVRESDDHYLIAAPSEMVALLRDLLGLDVRNKDYRDYGQSIDDLKEQIDGLTNSLHALYAERDALKADAERYRKLRDMKWYDGPLCVVRAPKGKVRPGTDCPSRERLDEALDSL